MDHALVIKSLIGIVTFAAALVVGLVAHFGRRIDSKQDEHAEKLSEFGESLVAITTTLSGVSGNNGVVGDVKILRSRCDEQGGHIQTLFGSRREHERRLKQLEGSG